MNKTTFFSNRDWYREEYLTSDHWKQLKSEKLKLHDMCFICGTKANLGVHHVEYKNIIDVRLDDLRVICACCHDKVHAIQNALRNTFIHKTTVEKWMDVIRCIKSGSTDEVLKEHEQMKSEVIEVKRRAVIRRTLRVCERAGMNKSRLRKIITAKMKEIDWDDILRVNKGDYQKVKNTKHFIQLKEIYGINHDFIKETIVKMGRHESITN